jgi:TorA-specific chaperone
MKMQVQNVAAAADDDWCALIAEWLAGLYLRPLTIETVRSFRNGPGSNFLDALALQPECSVGANRMRNLLLAGDDPYEVERRLSTEFSLLFDGVGGLRTVSPYESAYSSSSNRLFQGPTSDMNELLRQAEVSVRHSFNEPADHLSIELSLLARMMRNGASHWDRAALLDVHLLTFAQKFAARCSDVDRAGFYAATAELMVGFLHARRQALVEPVEHSKLPIERSGFKDAPSVNQGVAA